MTCKQIYVLYERSPVLKTDMEFVYIRNADIVYRYMTCKHTCTPVYKAFWVRVRVMVVNATFNNISVLLVEETGVPEENHRPTTSH
jgi:hypothetical protein